MSACFSLVARIVCFGVAVSNSAANAGFTSAEPSKPLEFRLVTPDQKPPLLELHLNAVDTYNTGFEGGDIYLSCYPNSIDYFRLNLVLYTSATFLFEQHPKAFIGIKNIDPSSFSPQIVPYVGEVEGTGEEDAPPSLFRFLDNVAAFQRAVGIWNEYEAGDENWLYVSSYPEAKFIQNLISSNVLSLIFYDKDSGKFYSALNVPYALDDAVFGQFEAECKKEWEKQP